MSRNYVLNTGNGVSLFVGSNQNLGFHTTKPSEKLTFEEGNAKFNSNVYVMKRVGVCMSNPTVELDVTGDAHVTGNMNIEGDMNIYNPISVNGFYVTKNSNYTRTTSISAAVHNIDINPSGTYFSVTNASQDFKFLATSNQKCLLKIPASGDPTVLETPLQITGDIIPSSNIAYDLGSSNFRFRDLYLSGNSINLGNVMMSSDQTTGSLSFQNKDTGAPATVEAKELIINDSGKTFKFKHTQGAIRLVAWSNNQEIPDISLLPNVFTSGSNVGIGISNPTVALHVNDSAIVNSCRISAYPFDTSFATFSHSNVNLNTGYALMQQSTGDTYLNASTGRSIRFRINNNDAAIISSAGRLGIGTTTPSTSLHVNATDAIILPTGTTDQRPSSLQQGMIRYNTTTNVFEGYGAGNAWSLIGGIKDTNQDTYISVESFPTSNDDTIRFYNANAETMTMTSNAITMRGTRLTLQDISEQGPIQTYVPPSFNVTSCNFVISGQSYGNGTYEIQASSRIDNAQVEHNAFDNNMSSRWMSAGEYNAGPGTYRGTKTTSVGGVNLAGEWIQIRLPQPIIPSRLRVLYNNGDINYAPQTFYLLGSKDAGVTWSSNILSVNTSSWLTNQTSSNQANVFNIPSSTDQYNAYRVVINKLIANDYAWISYMAIDGYTMKYSPANLGVGTNNPTETVDIVGNAKVSSNMYIMQRLGIGNSNPSVPFEVSGVAKFNSNVEVVGNLTIQGNTTTVNSTTVNITDNIIRLNNAASYNSSLQAGVEINRGSGYSNYMFVFDEALNYFRIGQTGQLQTVATRDDTLPNNSIILYDNVNKKFTACNTLVLNNGNLGVGTSTPSENITAASKMFAPTQVLGSTSATASVPAFSFRENSNTGLFSPATNTLGMATNGTERFRITNTGIGIFNSAPQEALHVGGKIFTTNQVLGYTGDTVNLPAYAWTDDIATGIYHPAASTIGFTTGATERMRLTSSGDLGIGTSTPSQRLHVRDGYAYVHDTRAGQRASLILQQNNNNTFNIQQDANGSATLENYGFNMQFLAYSNFIFYGKEGGNNTEVMRIQTASGNIGIGNSSPSYKLHVTGDIFASQDIIAYSDMRHKTDFEDIQDPLNIVSQMKGLYFKRPNDSNQRHVGFLAQDVNKVLPEVVRYDASNDMYGVNYGHVCAVLVEAVKQLQKELKEVKSQLSHPLEK